jgi:hypothetical protein
VCAFDTPPSWLVIGRRRAKILNVARFFRLVSRKAVGLASNTLTPPRTLVVPRTHGVPVEMGI